MTEHKLSLSRAFTSAKTQLNHVKRNLPRADGENILTFSGKRWCCRCNAVLLLPICRGGWCHAGAGALLPALPPRGNQRTLPVPAGSAVLSACLRDTVKLVFPRACPVKTFPFVPVTATDLSTCSKKPEICLFSFFLNGSIYYLLMTSRGHSSDGFCYDDCSKTLRLY